MCALSRFTLMAAIVAAALLLAQTGRAQAPPMTLRITFAAVPSVVPTPEPLVSMPTVAPTITPEPGTLTLIGLGLVGLAGLAVRRRVSSSDCVPTGGVSLSIHSHERAHDAHS